ncbi:hypothetical protein DEO72_LG11g3070 [Vigna unguiculata]|uniref:Uncharacterized protein n=1 Tax=Vigna unguiculata TaxID=3917 RepID=A0A4D6NW52_VIGUN|nr:hypothetical protein DEO72_LG11g3070 [Vigna unguiculata]
MAAMASRYRSISQPALSFIKSTITKPASKPTASAFLLKTRSPVTARQAGGWGARLRAVAASAALGGVLGAPHFLSRHRFE